MADEPVVTRTDPVVDRVNELTTTALDTAGVICLAAAAWFWAQRLTHGGPDVAWLFAGIVLIMFSVAVQRRRNAPRKPAVPARPHREVVLPGPEDPGNLHVKGR